MKPLTEMHLVTHKSTANSRTLGTNQYINFHRYLTFCCETGLDVQVTFRKKNTVFREKQPETIKMNRVSLTEMCFPYAAEWKAKKCKSRAMKTATRAVEERRLLRESIQ